MKILQLKAQCLPGLRRADGSVSLRFITAEEIDTELFSLIDSYRQQNGWLLFRANEFNESDIPTGDAEDESQLKLWERQQKAIYKLFMLAGGKPADFHTYYREQMAKIQTVITDKIETLEQTNDRSTA